MQMQPQMQMQYGGVAGALADGKASITHFGLRRNRRMNMVAMCFALFVPWVIFCLTYAMLSFYMHYYMAAITMQLTILIIGGLAGYWLLNVYRKFFVKTPIGAGGNDASSKSWTLFMNTTGLMAALLAAVLGNRNFLLNMEPFYDLSNLNSYQEVNPATVMGSELMDAGLVSFIPGTPVDLSRAMSFRNSDTYCVAPIARKDTPLSSYDFWAVGINCCGDASDAGVGFGSKQPSKDWASSLSSVGATWTCGSQASTARGGVRVMRNEDRSFYRLAVQQAQSAYQVRATHPLFFYWVDDPAAEAYRYLKNAYRGFLVSMYVAFAVQLTLVAIAAASFSEKRPDAEAAMTAA